MGRTRLPIELVQARGKKHLTKEEIAKRQAEQVKPICDDIVAPSYLTKSQQEEFEIICIQLDKLEVLGETDFDAVARYIISKDLYLNAVKQLRKKSVQNDPDMCDKWGKIQDRYFKQCRTSATDLGLTITSRCKLVVPQTEQVEAPANKFNKFEVKNNA